MSKDFIPMPSETVIFSLCRIARQIVPQGGALSGTFSQPNWPSICKREFTLGYFITTI